MADGSLKFDTKIDTEGVEKGERTIRKSLSDLLSSVNGMGNKMKNALDINTSGADQRIRNLVAEIDAVKDGLYYLEKEGFYFGDKEYDEAYAKLSKLEKELGQYKKSLSGVDNEQKKVAKSASKAGTSMNKAEKSASGFSKTMQMLKMSLMIGLAFQAMMAVMTAIKEGFQNLAQYSGETNKTLSDLGTALQTLKNSFATAFSPILTAIAPALQTLINYLSQALTVAGQFFAVFLNGSTTFTKAKDAQIDYAASLKKTKDEASKTLSPIDKLNNVSDAGSSSATAPGTPDPSKMFETVNIDPRIVSTANTITNGIMTALGALNTWLTTNFSPIFSSIWTNLQPKIQTFKNIVAGMFTDMQSLGQPLLDYFNGSFTPYLQQAFTTAGAVVVGLFDSFNKVFSDIWNLAVFPILSNFVTVILPMLTDFGTQVFSLLIVVFNSFKTIFDMIWSDAISPALALATTIWTDFANILAAFWNKWGKPLFDNLKQAFQTTTDLFVSLWKKFLKPIWDKWMVVLDELWKNHFSPLLTNILDFIGKLANGALTIYNKFIAPLLKWFITTLGPPISKVITGMLTTFGEFMGGVVDAASDIIEALGGIVDFIVGVFTGDWDKAWNGLKTAFKKLWDAMVDIVKVPVNLIIDVINGLVSGVVAGINAVIKAINGLGSIKVPKIPGITDGFTIGLNLSTITAPKIPRLATGTVVPANYGEFLSIMGDNTKEAEVVSPVSTMKQAFKEAIQEMGDTGSGDINVNVYLSGKQIHTEVVKVDKEYKAQTGKSAFAY